MISDDYDQDLDDRYYLESQRPKNDDEDRSALLRGRAER
jgi:hypothetical protein